MEKRVYEFKEPVQAYQHKNSAIIYELIIQEIAGTTNKDVVL